MRFESLAVDSEGEVSFSTSVLWFLYLFEPREHLYRCHQISPHCKRCWRTFKTQQQLDSHITVAATDICDVQSGNPPTGITPAVERQLRSRKKSHPNQTDEERWKDIYKILFPNVEIPSPCKFPKGTI